MIGSPVVSLRADTSSMESGGLHIIRIFPQGQIEQVYPIRREAPGRFEHFPERLAVTFKG